MKSDLHSTPENLKKKIIKKGQHLKSKYGMIIYLITKQENLKRKENNIYALKRCNVKKRIHTGYPSKIVTGTYALTV